jgi:hypothetical protein
MNRTLMALPVLFNYFLFVLAKSKMVNQNVLVFEEGFLLI